MARHRDRGAVTAEVAVSIPAVVLVLTVSLGGLSLATTQLRAQDAAADAARLLGRGETELVAQQHVARLVTGARLAVSRSSSLVCVRVEVEQLILAVPIAVAGTSCALEGGR